MRAFGLYWDLPLHGTSYRYHMLLIVTGRLLPESFLFVICICKSHLGPFFDEWIMSFFPSSLFNELLQSSLVNDSLPLVSISQVAVSTITA